jgi:3'-phosphoadenosine 5'-phosphosulfate sulfotransferase (PAPS reductase)/FAD synthetase
MLEIEKLQHIYHAKLQHFQRKVEKSRAIIDEAISKIDHPYLAFSGGIDSYVLLDLLYSAGNRVFVVFGDDGYDYPESLQFLSDTEERYNFHLHRVRCMQPWRDWCKEMMRPDLCDDPEALAAWGNPPVWDETQDSLKDLSGGYDGTFLGLLASESRSRTYALKGGTKPLYQVKSEGDRWHCSPLAHWSKRDVWGYIVSRELPYNPVYDKLAELGIPLDHRRVAPLTCYRVMQYGSHVWLRSGWPALYHKLAATFSVIASYS